MPKQRICKFCNIEFTSYYNKVGCDSCRKPSLKCPHGTKKGRCKIDGCFGNEICLHKQHKQKCPICKPGINIADKLNASIIRFMNNANIKKNTINFILEYTSVPSLEVLKEHLSQNLNDELSISNCHLDHIIPKANFNLKNKNELLECCHYTNLQFIHETLNLSKGCKLL